MLLMPIEASGIIASLAGIAELAKESLSQQHAATAAHKSSPPPTPR
jgi:hypothetical protein